MGRYKDPSTGTWKKEYAMPIGDTLPIGSEVDYNGSVVPYGWEEVDEENAKIVYKKYVTGDNTETYTFPDETSLYLLIANTNGNGLAMMDIVSYYSGSRELVSTRIKDNTTYKTITYSSSDRTVTMHNISYGGIYTIIKIF